MTHLHTSLVLLTEMDRIRTQIISTIQFNYLKLIQKKTNKKVK